MASIPAFVNGFVIRGYHTQTAGTSIDEYIQGQEGQRLALIGFEYLAAATAHTLSIMHCGGNSGQRTTADGGAVITQKLLDVADAPKDGAGNATESGDIIAYRVENGTWEWNTVASLSTKEITLGTNIAVAVPDGAAVRIFGVVGDNVSHKIHLTASVVTSKYDSIIAMSPFTGDPIYLESDNGTDAGFLYNMIFAYINK